MADPSERTPWMRYIDNPCAETARAYGASWISRIMRAEENMLPVDDAIRWMEEAVRLAPTVVMSVPEWS